VKLENLVRLHYCHTVCKSFWY